MRTLTRLLSAYVKALLSSLLSANLLAGGAHPRMSSLSSSPEQSLLFSGRTAGVELLEHKQAMGVLLRQANARAIFRRHPGTAEEGDDPVLAAVRALEA